MAIKLLIIDVDGTMTDGMILYGDNNLEIKAFSTRDGAVLKPLCKLGIDVVFMTGRASEATSRRAADLNVSTVQGVEDKSSALNEMLVEYSLLPEQCAYIGDDLNDFAAMKLCGFKACPADAVAEIRGICDYISPYKGGYGAVRDICEKLLIQEQKHDDFLNYYGVCK
jgi:3-deoxy-D-manno-octulosonate 8-phosphate phosphatase (KDO 8-P phosphatase)